MHHDVVAAHEEDFEFHVLQKKTCPFCRVAVAADVLANNIEEPMSPESPHKIAAGRRIGAENGDQ